MTENQERAEQARSAFTVNGGNVQILPNATIAIQNIHWGDGTVTRTERWITPAESGLHESPSPPINSPAPPVTAEPSSLALFIPDEATRLVYEARLCACPDTVTLCQTVLTDLYNEILADYSSPLKLGQEPCLHQRPLASPHVRERGECTEHSIWDQEVCAGGRDEINERS